MKLEEPTLEELLKPLSAKVMPRSFMFSAGGNELTQQGALAKQRIEAGNKISHPKRKAGRPSKHG